MSVKVIKMVELFLSALLKFLYIGKWEKYCFELDLIKLIHP